MVAIRHLPGVPNWKPVRAGWFMRRPVVFSLSIRIGKSMVSPALPSVIDDTEHECQEMLVLKPCIFPAK
jgi:hypothetical protein